MFHLFLNQNKLLSYTISFTIFLHKIDMYISLSALYSPNPLYIYIFFDKYLIMF